MDGWMMVDKGWMALWDGRDLCYVRGERDANGHAGRSLYAVKRCKVCRTIWNRDVNAARNIGLVFWWLRSHGGSRPPGFRRITRRDGGSGDSGAS